MQNLQLIDGTLSARVSNMENGLQQLDEKVSLIDKKVDHLGNVQMEMYDDQNRMSENLSSELRHQKEQLNKWQSDMKKELYRNGKWHYYGMGCALLGWLLFMLIWLFN